MIRTALAAGAVLVATLAVAPAAQARHQPWVIDHHAPIVNFVPCASAPLYPFGPTCAAPAIQHETRHRGAVTQTRGKFWYYLGDDGGAVVVSAEGFYASKWSHWRTVQHCTAGTVACLLH